MTTHASDTPGTETSAAGHSMGEQGQSSDWSWVPKALALLSGTSVTLLLLLGYGVALAVESRLGVARSSLYEGVTDLLELSSIAIMMGLSSMSHSLGELFTLVYRQQGWFIGAMLMAWPLLIAGRWLVALGRAGGVAQRWPRVGRLLSCVKCLVFGWPQLWFPLAIVVSPAFAALAVAACMVVVSLPVFAVVIGMGAGHSYLTQYVLEPTACASSTVRTWPVSPPAAEKALKRKSDASVGATCLVIEDQQGKVLARGRLAVSTTKALVIVPKDGAARLLDSKGLTQYGVGEL